MSEIDTSFVDKLFQKLALTKNIAAETTKNTDAAQNEVWRQVKQTSPKKGGDPITGEGVTKSGGTD
jgi:hypothetical protein